MGSRILIRLPLINFGYRRLEWVNILLTITKDPEVCTLCVKLKHQKMSNFNRSDLQKRYSWSTDGGDNPKLRGNPDSSLLDRTEGYEVLYMIQRLMDLWSLKNVASGHKIEDKIHACPSNLRSQENVQKWIHQNW